MNILPSTRNLGSVRRRASATVARYKEISATRDSSALAATLTFYGAIAVVPLLLLSLRACALVTSASWVEARGDDVASLLPDALGARSVVLQLVSAGAELSLLHCVLAIFPATFYGEGLRRALISRRRPRPTSFDGWRGRLALVPVAVVAPLLLLGVLASAEWLADATTGGGVAALLLRVWLGFVVVWLVLGVLVAGAYSIVAAEDIPFTVVWWCAAVTASFIAGFVQGFVLFLAIPVSLGAPFGGLTTVGAAIAIGLWMWVLHVLLITGWTFTQATAQVVAQGPRADDAPPPGVEPAR